MSEGLTAVLVLTVICSTIGGIMILRPIAKGLGEYLETLVREKREALSQPDQSLLRRPVEDLEARVELLERQLEFTESLLTGPPTGIPVRGVDSREGPPPA